MRQAGQVHELPNVHQMEATQYCLCSSRTFVCLHLLTFFGIYPNKCSSSGHECRQESWPFKAEMGEPAAVKVRGKVGGEVENGKAEEKTEKEQQMKTEAVE